MRRPRQGDEQDIQTLRERICFYEKAVEAYGPDAWDLVVPRFSPDSELAGPIDPVARGPPDRERVEEQRLNLSRRLDVKRKLFEGRLLWSYRDYVALIDPPISRDPATT
ncbi:MAG: hypothetical protein ACRD6W_09220 [Nitrososphaerales archaeon]